MRLEVKAGLQANARVTRFRINLVPSTGLCCYDARIDMIMSTLIIMIILSSN